MPLPFKLRFKLPKPRFNLPKPLRFFILFYLSMFIIVGGFFYYAISSSDELSVCFDLYDDPTVDSNIRDHCRKRVDEWRTDRDAKEMREYIENF